MRAPRHPPPDAAWYPLAGFLMLGGPMFAELYRSQYPFDRVEGLLLPLALGAIGALAATLVRRWKEPVATLSFALLVLVFVDLQFDLERRFAPLLVVVTALIMVALFQRYRALLMVVMLAGFYLSIVPTRWRADRRVVDAPDAAPAAAARPPVLLHVILDGQWGPAGLLAGGEADLSAELDAFYSGRGFRVYRGAYSQYSATRLSLGSLAALGEAPPIRSVGGGAYQLTSNPYFDYLARRGYRIRVYQSSHLDFCPPAPPYGRLVCFTASSGSIGNVGYIRGRWQPRAELALRFFLGVRSQLYRRIFGEGPVALRRSAAARAVAWVETVRRSIAAGEADAYFVHLILPHPPFEVDSACVGYPSLAQRMANNSGPTGKAVGQRLAAYAGQSRCAHRALAGLIATLDSVVGPRSIVVVHGDHGPKLVPAGEDLQDYSPEALNHYFSTLFSIRAPNIVPEAVPGAVSIQELLARLVRSDFTAAAAGSGVVRIFEGPGSSDLDSVRVLAPDEVRWVPLGSDGGTAASAAPRLGGTRPDGSRR